LGKRLRSQKLRRLPRYLRRKWNRERRRRMRVD